MHSFNWRALALRMPRLLQRFLPGSCALCFGDSPHALCDACSMHIFSRTALRCVICARRLQEAHEKWCGACLKSPPAYDATIVACDYAAPTDLLVKDLKFRARLPLAHTFAHMLTRSMRSQQTDQPDLIIPVPLSEARLAERGFNQAAEIARSLARITGIPLQLSLCARVRDTQPQAGLPLRERQVNMRGAFTVVLDTSLRAQLRHRHVMLVDDVMTTGHTLNELAACLKRQGVARVTNAVFARTPHQ